MGCKKEAQPLRSPAVSFKYFIVPPKSSLGVYYMLASSFHDINVAIITRTIHSELTDLFVMLNSSNTCALLHVICTKHEQCCHRLRSGWDMDIHLLRDIQMVLFDQVESSPSTTIQWKCTLFQSELPSPKQVGQTVDCVFCGL